MSARVIVCGSRRWHDRTVIANRLHDLVLSYPRGTWITIVHGDARGADRIAHQEAQKHGMLVEPHPYQPFIGPTVPPKIAPLTRNEHMAKLGADLCIAFQKDGSTGTAHMITQAKLAGIPVEVIT